MAMRSWRNLVAVVLLGGLLFLSPAGAHVSDNFTHLWSDHIKGKVKDLTYTKNAANARFMPKVIRPGQTVKGVIGGRIVATAAGQEVAWSASLPAAAPVGLTDATVTIDGVDEASGECPGTSTNPTAAPG